MIPIVQGTGGACPRPGPLSLVGFFGTRISEVGPVILSAAKNLRPDMVPGGEGDSSLRSE